jgi:hypothetical protein
MPQTRFIWPDDETPPRRPARVRAVAERVSLTLRQAPTAEQREAQREMLAEALAEALWAELVGSAQTPCSTNRTAPMEDDTRG